MSVLETSAINKLNRDLGKGTSTQNNVLLEPNVQVTTNIFDLNDVNSSIMFRSTTSVTNHNIEIVLRYHDSSGTVIAVGETIIAEVNSVYFAKVVNFKGHRVSFRLVNQESTDITLSSICVTKASVLEKSSLQQGLSLTNYGLTTGQNAIPLFEMPSVDSVIHIRANGTLPTNSVTIVARYYDPINPTVILSFETIFEGVLTTYNAIPFKAKNSFVGFRIDVLEDIDVNVFIAKAHIEQTTDMPLSPDGNLLIEQADTTSAGYDSFYGAHKNLKVHRPLFFNSLFPDTNKQNTTTETTSFNLQNGVEQVTFELGLTVNGNPFPNTNDGVYLRIEMGNNDVYLTKLETEKLKVSGNVLAIIGANNSLADVETESNLKLLSSDLIYGNVIQTSVLIVGNLNATDNIDFNLKAYSKIK